VEVKSVETVTDDDLLAADGIAIGSPKNPGHCISPPIYALVEQLNRLRSQLHDKVGTAFSGSHGSFGGQEIVNQTLFRAILSSNMLAVGLPQPDEHWNDFAGGVIVEELDERTGDWAHSLGARLATAARRLH
jgi:NAD(P)H-dependent FMN reductase